jgi:hypothetical protein
MATHPSLSPAKGWRIATGDILPTEKEGSGACLLGGIQGMPGGSVVGFFVDVYKIGLKALDQLGEFGVVMRVKVPVKANGGDV